MFILPYYKFSKLIKIINFAQAFEKKNQKHISFIVMILHNTIFTTYNQTSIINREISTTNCETISSVYYGYDVSTC